MYWPCVVNALASRACPLTSRSRRSCRSARAASSNPSVCLTYVSVRPKALCVVNAYQAVIPARMIVVIADTEPEWSSNQVSRLNPNISGKLHCGAPETWSIRARVRWPLRSRAGRVLEPDAVLVAVLVEDSYRVASVDTEK